jgi:hypothetical protein
MDGLTDASFVIAEVLLCVTSFIFYVVPLHEDSMISYYGRRQEEQQNMIS